MKPSKSATILACLSVLCAFFPSCMAKKEGAQATLAQIELKVGGKACLAETARSQKEQSIGLMYRASLADGKGMVFVFSEEHKPVFWMKNTLIPLSIAYISKDGVIMDILDMTPLSEAPVASSHYVAYALEVPQGWFDRQGIQPGDLVEGLPRP